MVKNMLSKNRLEVFVLVYRRNVFKRRPCPVAGEKLEAIGRGITLPVPTSPPVAQVGLFTKSIFGKGGESSGKESREIGCDGPARKQSNRACERDDRPSSASLSADGVLSPLRNILCVREKHSQSRS